MGVPVIDAASEAESQCAELAKKKKVWGMASEDMDSLTFGTPVLIRHLTKSQGSKKEAQSILEVDLAEVLEAMKLSMDEVSLIKKTAVNCSLSTCAFCADAIIAMEFAESGR